MPWACATVVAALLFAASPAVRRIEVDRDRLRLGDFVGDLDAASATLDAGPAPALGAERVLTRSQLLARLGGTAAGIAPALLPASVLVSRPAQRLTAAEVEGHVRAAIDSHLPPGATLRSLRAAASVLLPRGEVRAELEIEHVVAGRQTLLARLHAGGESRAVLVAADVGLPVAPVVVRRGERVSVMVSAGAVRLQVAGIAQESGSAGARIAVLPSCAAKLVHAVVIDADTVEVTP